MKAPLLTQIRKGFTLIELLVVILIIGVLGAVAYPLIMGQVTKAEISSTKQQCINIIQAVTDYREDNSDLLPLNDDSKDNYQDEKGCYQIITDGSQDAGFINIISNNGPDAEDFNQHERNYLKADKKDEPAGGLYEGSEAFAFYDSWGSPFYITLNPMREKGCPDPFTGSSVSAACLVYSLGPDKEGIAAAHKNVGKSSGSKKSSSKSKTNSKDKKSSKEKKPSKAERKAAEAAQREEDEEAIEDNVYSWKNVK